MCQEIQKMILKKTNSEDVRLSDVKTGIKQQHQHKVVVVQE